MIHANFHDALADGCRVVGIEVPRKTAPGRWVQCPVVGKAQTNTSGRVMVFDDGRGGIAHNWATGQQHTFRVGGEGAGKVAAPHRDPQAERRERAEREAIARVCADIVRGSQQAVHPYLARKGFPDEIGLVHEAPWRHFPQGYIGEILRKTMPEGEGPWLIVPGRIGRSITTVQFITPEGAKKNIWRGQLGGASHRIAMGRDTWICEGIATALTVRAALRLLGRSATVISAFSAGNVGKVAAGLPGAVVAADHDAPNDGLGGIGAGEYYARKSGRTWAMPPAIGDWNDLHQAEGLRAVALALRGIGMG